MFGYIRPLKAELLVREWTRYRAAYCGLCQTIAARYGQVPRLLLSYDLTFYVLLGESLLPELAEAEKRHCLLTLKPRLLCAAGTWVQDLAADLTILMAGARIADDRADGACLRAGGLALALAPALKAARRREKELADTLEAALRPQGDLETCIAQGLSSWELAAEPSAKLLKAAATALAGRLPATIWQTAGIGVADGQAALARLGEDLGRWIYWSDALDDLEGDRKRKAFNPLFYVPSGEAAEAAARTKLEQLERALDLDCAYLPYQRDAGLICNIICQGLPALRRQISQKQDLPCL